MKSSRGGVTVDTATASGHSHALGLGELRGAMSGLGYGTGDAQKDIAEWNWSGVADTDLVLPADHGHHADTAGLGVTMTFKGDRVQLLFTLAPDQFRKIFKGDAADVQPGQLVREVAVVALVNAAGPSSKHVSRYPSATAGRGVQIEVRPSLAVCGMFNNAAPGAGSVKRVRKAAAIITQLELVRFAGAAMEETPPTLAAGMRHNRPGAGVFASVAMDCCGTVSVILPVIGDDARQAEIAPVGRNIEGRNLLHLLHPHRQPGHLFDDFVVEGVGSVGIDLAKIGWIVAYVHAGWRFQLAFWKFIELQVGAVLIETAVTDGVDTPGTVFSDEPTIRAWFCRLNTERQVTGCPPLAPLAHAALSAGW